MTMHGQPLIPGVAPLSGTPPRTGMPSASWERCSNFSGAEEAGAAAAGRGDGEQDRRLAEGSSAIPRPDRRCPLARRHRSHGEPRQALPVLRLLSRSRRPPGASRATPPVRERGVPTKGFRQLYCMAARTAEANSCRNLPSRHTLLHSVQRISQTLVALFDT